MTKCERLAVFLEELRRAPAQETAEGAARLVGELLDLVESEQGPVGDAASMRLPPVNVTAYDMRGHEMFLAHNGAVLIREKPTGRVLVDRPGLSGSHVADFAPWLKSSSQ